MAAKVQVRSSCPCTLLTASRDRALCSRSLSLSLALARSSRSWSPSGARIAAGSSDGMLNIWDVQTGALTYKLPGHSGAVTDVAWHPTEPILASCSTDMSIYMGEIKAE